MRNNVSRDELIIILRFQKIYERKKDRTTDNSTRWRLERTEFRDLKRSGGLSTLRRSKGGSRSSKKGGDDKLHFGKFIFVVEKCKRIKVLWEEW
jgi:hypothetical protein